MLNKALYTNILVVTIAFSETNKFNGTNWSSWQRLIHTVAISKGVFGYLDRSIKCPSTSLTIATISAILAMTTVPTEILWDFETLSLKE